LFLKNVDNFEILGEAFTFGSALGELNLNTSWIDSSNLQSNSIQSANLEIASSYFNAGVASLRLGLSKAELNEFQTTKPLSDYNKLNLKASVHDT
jgi:hypothetical protein